MGDEVGDTVEHRAMAGDPGQSGELLRHDEQGKVPASGSGAGVPGMLGAVVGKFEHDRRKRREPGPEGGFDGTAHDLLGSVM